MAFTIEFKLKQQTPLIHFQYDHDGATLRASEVKAKLDKYIWEKEWQNDLSKGWKHLIGASKGLTKELKDRFLEKGYRALDYKLSFITTEWQQKDIPDKYPLFFGNMDNEEEEKEKKHFISAPKGVDGLITSFDFSLLEAVQKHIVHFFQINNFGSRQNKGFGSFKLELLNGKTPKYLPPSKYYFTLPQQGDKELFNAIDLFYRTLRSGINLKDAGPTDKLYFKSLMFQYAKTKDEQWDKRKIRIDLFGKHRKFIDVEQTRSDDPLGTVIFNVGTPKLYRDMLGLSSSQMWYNYDRANVTKGAPGIDRFKSPITFKPIKSGNKWEVYIISNSIPSHMKGIEFTIESKDKQSTLTTPEFDLNEYLRFAFSYFSDRDLTIEEYVGKNNAHNELKIIQNIYDQLSEQL